MRITDQSLKTFLKRGLIVVVLLQVVACSKSDKEDSRLEPRDEPRTFYGQSVKRTKDLSRDLEKHDQDVGKQADSMFDE